MKNLYMREFYSGYKTWELNKLVGDGVRSYKINCAKTDVVNCGPHPHNYFLEILADLGLFGLIILYILFFKIIFDYFRLKFILKSNLENSYIFIPFFYLMVVEFFPIRTSGSFFTTSNASFIFFILSITIALSIKKT